MTILTFIARGLRGLADRLDPPKYVPPPVQPVERAPGQLVELPPDLALVHVFEPSAAPVHSKKRVDERRIQDAQAAFEERGLDWRSHGSGWHLQVRSQWGWADYWPTTERWWIGGRSMKGRGLPSLFKVLGVQ